MQIQIWFFFSSRRRHTRWPRDWSSDVCSSDLERPARYAVEIDRDPGGAGLLLQDLRHLDGAGLDRAGHERRGQPFLPGLLEQGFRLGDVLMALGERGVVQGVGAAEDVVADQAEAAVHDFL